MSDWSDDCPDRGPGLSHAHWNQCKPEKGGHSPTDPTTLYAGRVHQWTQCCHCEQHIGEARNPAFAPEGSLDHPFLTDAHGRCRAGCGNPQSSHPKQHSREAGEQQAEEFGVKVCPVNHASINPKHLIGDGGLIWTACPNCGTVLEPKLATGKLDGRRWGKGRGDFNPFRDGDRLLGIVGWREWLSRHGGGELPGGPEN